MDTGFASKVLEIAQKRESERITIVQEKVLKVFSKICQQRIKRCSPFAQGEYVSIPIDDLIEADIQKSDFIRICNASPKHKSRTILTLRPTLHGQYSEYNQTYTPHNKFSFLFVGMLTRVTDMNLSKPPL